MGIAEITDHYEAIIRGLDKPPIIIGHSFGGTVTQLLLDRGVGAAGVCLNSAVVKGIKVVPWLRSGPCSQFSTTQSIGTRRWD